MLAGLGGGDGVRRVQVVPVTQVDSFDVGFPQHRVQVRVDRIGVRSLRIRACGVFDDVAHGRHPYPVGVLQVGREVRIGDAPGTHEANLQWFRHVPFPLRAAFVDKGE